MDGLDLYLREKGVKHVAESACFLISEDEVIVAAVNARESILQDQPADVQARFLVQQLTETLDQRRYGRTQLLTHTALTNLFAANYDVDIARHTGGDGGGLYIQGGLASRSAGNAVYLNYGAEQGEHPGLFWQLSIDQEYGFANMHCVGPLGNVMLRGSANIIGVDGVADALREDITLLSENTYE